MPLSPEESELVLRAACCLAAIDGRLTRSEIANIAKVLSALGAPPELFTDESILGIAQSVHRDGAQQTVASVREQLTWNRTTDAAAAIRKIYDAMGFSGVSASKDRLAQVMLQMIPADQNQQPVTPQPQIKASKPALLAKAAVRGAGDSHTILQHTYFAWAAVAQMLWAISFCLDSNWRSGKLWGLTDSQRFTVALLSAVAVGAAMQGLFLSYAKLQDTRGGAVVPPAVGFCLCLYMLWGSFFW